MKEGAFKRFLSELKRRNVYKSALAYIVAGWIILQVLAVTLPSFQLPLTIIKWTVFALALGFPFWLMFSWVYEFTPEGIKKTVNVNPAESIGPQTSYRLNKIIIAALSIAVVLLLVNTFKTRSDTTAAPIEKNKLLVEDNVDDKSIAVLAFADMSKNQDQEYFSDGISEEILNLLAKIPDLRVISRTSSFSFKDKDATVAEIGEALNISHILEGSVRKSGNTLRITAQLINVENGAHLWSKTYDKEMEDIFKIQDEIATAVTKELKATLLGGDIVSKTVNTDAYDLYLRAKYEDRTAEGIKRAEGLLEQSIAIDSSYAPTWGLLSKFQLMSGVNFLIRPASEAIELAMQSIQKAIHIDPEYAAGYAQLAYIQHWKWEFEKAASNMKKAVQLDPENISLRIGAANIKFASLDEKIALQKIAIALDPLRYGHYFNLSLYLFWDNRLGEAEEAFLIFESHYSDDAILKFIMSRVLLGQGKKEKALEIAEKEPDDFFKLYAKNFVVFALGKQKEADDLLAKLIKEYNASATSNIAEIYAYRGEVDNAFLWLDKALEIKDPALLEAIFYPAFKVLYKDPRWNELIHKIGLPKDHGVPMGEKVLAL